MFWSAKLTALTAAVVVAGGTALVATSVDKTVALTVDGRTQSATTFAGTVGDLLSAQGISVGSRDLVIPAVDSSLTDGGAVQVSFARKVTLLIDGEPTELYTTATTLDGALDAAQVRGLDGAELSVSRSVAIGRDGLTVDVRTPRTVTLSVAGKKTSVTTTATTVAELLGEHDLALDSDDTVKPALTTALDDASAVTINRVTVTTKSVRRSIERATVRTKSKSLYAGQSKVTTAGRDGVAKVTYQLTSVNGADATRKVIDRQVLRTPVTRQVLIGTKPAPTGAGSTSGGGLNLARAAMWDRIARCESGGNWSINTGNGYYGGLQFAASTWRGAGGTDFAPFAHQASRAEQITVANRLYARAGLQPWGCRHAA